MKRILKVLTRVKYNRKQIFDIVYIKLRDRIKKLDTLGGVQTSKLGIQESLMPVFYESSANHYLVKLIRQLNITNYDSILDLGCGKGGTLILFRQFPFKKITGVEYSELLFNVASKNIQVFKDKRLHVIHGDASKYSNLDEINYVYMFNPFGIVTMKPVLDNICKSYKTNPRKITIIYLNPVLHDEIIKTKVFTQVEVYDSAFDYNFNIYESELCHK